MAPADHWCPLSYEPLTTTQQPRRRTFCSTGRLCALNPAGGKNNTAAKKHNYVR